MSKKNRASSQTARNIMNNTAPISKSNKQIINDIFKNHKLTFKNVDKHKSNILLPGNLYFDEKMEFPVCDPNCRPKLIINKFNNFGWEFTDKQNVSETFQVKLDELRGNKAGHL